MLLIVILVVIWVVFNMRKESNQIKRENKIVQEQKDKAARIEAGRLIIIKQEKEEEKRKKVFKTHEDGTLKFDHAKLRRDSLFYPNGPDT